MQIVMDIPNFIYKQILKSHVSKKTIAKVFENGTPLPKGHGRLIDADIVNEMLNSLDGCTAELDKAFNVIDTTPTVLEGSKE